MVFDIARPICWCVWTFWLDQLWRSSGRYMFATVFVWHSPQHSPQPFAEWCRLEPRPRIDQRLDEMDHDLWRLCTQAARLCRRDEASRSWQSWELKATSCRSHSWSRKRDCSFGTEEMVWDCPRALSTTLLGSFDSGHLFDQSLGFWNKKRGVL